MVDGGGRVVAASRSRYAIRSSNEEPPDVCELRCPRQPEIGRAGLLLPGWATADTLDGAGRDPPTSPQGLLGRLSRKPRRQETRAQGVPRARGVLCPVGGCGDTRAPAFDIGVVGSFGAELQDDGRNSGREGSLLSGRDPRPRRAANLLGGSGNTGRRLWSRPGIGRGRCLRASGPQRGRRRWSCQPRARGVGPRKRSPCGCRRRTCSQGGAGVLPERWRLGGPRRRGSQRRHGR